MSDDARIQRTEAYAEKVRQLFAQTANDLTALARNLPDTTTGTMYSFDGESERIQKQVEQALRKLHSVATLAIKKGIKLEWAQANQACDKLVKSAFGKKVVAKGGKYKGYTNRNEMAMNAFINRSDEGLNLSKRVWQSCRQLRDEMEVAITCSIGEGVSAQEMSQSVRKYLNDPDLMFRRFRYKDKNGNWRKKWKKRIKMPDGHYKWIDYDRSKYIPTGAGKNSQGVYKSSAKNAMRVCRTETNMAYRNADFQRWQQMDFVLGIRIETSTHAKARKVDICDELAGDYPKTFKFEGWHPQCFCIATPILVPEEEMMAKAQAEDEGKTYTFKSKPITDFPDNFKSYCKANQDRIQQARQEGREPYFLAHNQDAVDEILNPKAVAMVSENQVKQAPPTQSNLPKTPAQKKAEWETDLQTQGNHGHLTQDECTAIAQNMVDIEQALGVAKGDFMTYEQADKQSANPKYVPYIIKDANGKRIKNPNYIKSRDESYTENCQTCAPAYLLRLRGFDITAKPYTKGSKSDVLGRDIFAVWVNVDGTQVTPIKTRDWMLNNGHKRMSESLYLDYFNEVCKEVGVYEIGLNFKGGGGHATILQRFPDGTLKYIEPQIDNSQGSGREWDDIYNLVKELTPSRFDKDCAILRIDNKLFKVSWLDIFEK